MCATEPAVTDNTWLQFKMLTALNPATLWKLDRKTRHHKHTRMHTHLCTYLQGHRWLWKVKDQRPWPHLYHRCSRWSSLTAWTSPSPHQTYTHTFTHTYTELPLVNTACLLFTSHCSGKTFSVIFLWAVTQTRNRTCTMPLLINDLPPCGDTVCVYERKGAAEERSLWWRLLLWGISTSSRSTLPCHGAPHTHTQHAYTLQASSALQHANCLLIHLIHLRQHSDLQRNFESCSSEHLITSDVNRQSDWGQSVILRIFWVEAIK